MAWNDRGAVFTGQLCFKVVEGKVQLAHRWENYPRGSPCQELETFDCEFCTDRNYLPDWPTIWAVVLFDKNVGEGEPCGIYASYKRARGEARRLAVELMDSQYSGRQDQQEALEAAEENDAQLQSLADFDAALAGEAVLFGRLTSKGVDLFTFWLGDDFADRVADLQKNTAWALLRAVSVGLKLLPRYVKLLVFAFAFTPRALEGDALL